MVHKKKKKMLSAISLCRTDEGWQMALKCFKVFPETVQGQANLGQLKLNFERNFQYYLSIYMCVCMYIYTHLYVYVCMSYIYIYIMYMCVYTHTHTNTYTHTHTDIQTYTHTYTLLRHF